MNARIISSIESLKKAIDVDPRILHLNEVEKQVSNNEEVKKLSASLKKIEEEYSFLLMHYGDKNEKTIAAHHSLYEAKLALDSHPLVKEYSSAYIAVRDLYMLIDDILFSPYRRKILHIDSL